MNLKLLRKILFLTFICTIFFSPYIYSKDKDDKDKKDKDEKVKDKEDKIKTDLIEHSDESLIKSEIIYSENRAYAL